MKLINWFRMSWLALWMACAGAASAQEPAQSSRGPVSESNAAAKSTARRLAEQGLDAYDQQDYATALEKLSQANALYPAPTVGLYEARCLAKLGRLVEASERYLATSRVVIAADLAEDLKTAQLEAQRDAGKERALLLPRIPTLTIVVQGASPGEPLSCLLNGKVVPAAMIGIARDIDPGAFAIVASAGARQASGSVVLKEGEHRRVIVRLAGQQPAAVAFPPPILVPIVSRPLEAPRRVGSAQRIVGWVGISVGGAALVAGAISGGVVLKLQNKLESRGCADGECPPNVASDIDEYDRMRIAASALIFGGAALAATGVVVLLTAPKTTAGTPRTPGFTAGTPGTAPAKAFIAPRLGATSAWLYGRF